MLRTPRKPAARPGFTLVELMVAAALTIVIMTILAVAFQTGMDTLSQLKSVAGLSEQLRAAQATITRDLTAPHLEDAAGNPVRVSDNQVAAAAWVNPSRGYFFVSQTVPNYEGTDPDLVVSSRSTNDVLRMTVELSGRSAQDVFAAPAPANVPLAAGSLADFDPTGGQQLVSRWAEVVYFLKPTAIVTADDGSGNPATALQVYTLYRRQVVLGASSAQTPESNGANSTSNFPDVSWSRVVPPGTPVMDRVNIPSDVTVAANRLGGANDPNGAGAGVYPIPATSTRYGTDVLLNNVVSMQVLAMTEPAVPQVPIGGVTNPFAFGPALGPNGVVPTPNPWTPTWSYDTAVAPGTPGRMQPRLRAVQVKLRVYDTKNKITRQVTITQDL